MNTFKEFADKHNVTVQAQSIPFRPDHADNQWHKDAVHFAVQLFAGDALIWQGCYSVGSAHAEMWAKSAKRFAGQRADIRLNPKSTDAEKGRQTIVAAYKLAAPLEPASILCSLHCDISGLAPVFEDWAADLGYDDDSREALRIFRACHDTKRSLQERFTTEAMAEFLECEDQ